MAAAPPDEPELVQRTLRAISPRAAQALILRFVEPRSRVECAAFYGIRPEAFDVMILRAARQYADAQRRLFGEGIDLPPPAGEFPAEQAQAGELERCLAGGVVTSALAPLAALLSPIAVNARQVRERIDAAERAEESSPAYIFETWVRRALVLLILGLTLFFYLRSEQKPRLEPRPRVPSVGR